MNNFRYFPALAALMLLANCPARAEPDCYVGATAGLAEWDRYDDYQDRLGLTGAGMTVVKTEPEKKDAGGRVFFGYALYPNFALEAGYVDMGSMNDKVTVKQGANTGYIGIHAKTIGIDLTAVGKLNITDESFLFAKIGVVHWKMKVTSGQISGYGQTPGTFNSRPQEEIENDLTGGFGFELGLNNSWSLRSEANAYILRSKKLFVTETGNSERIRVGVASIGAVYKF